ncbi:hypothetical protein ACFU9Y_03900 [Streptomyces sp. NPDC057621]|uniref:DUF7848 domain-containing protein n=1 Tax=Streptomyces sp. NPDC057621 TaxID=3346186 RepID=UPI003679CFE9
MKSILQAAEWTLATDTVDGQPKPTLYEAWCLTCKESSDVTEGERLPAEIWALKHTGLRPQHRTFAAIITTTWRVSPAEGNPFHEMERRQ